MTEYFYRNSQIIDYAISDLEQFLDPDLALAIDARLRVTNRFWPSEVFFRVATSFDKKPTEAFFKIASAIELFHLYTLIHDDIIDAHETRWNKPSLQSEFGIGIALLCGDLLLSLGSLILSRIPMDLSVKLTSTYAQYSTSVAFGQMLDWNISKQSGIEESDYFNIAKLKASAGILAAQLATIVSDLDDTTSEKIHLFAVHCGMASQIANDIAELSGLRGFQEPYIQQRGLSEFLLGRKTIFHVHVLKSKKQQGEIDLLNQNELDKLTKILDDHKSVTYAISAYRNELFLAKASISTIKNNDSLPLLEYLSKLSELGNQLELQNLR